MFCVTDNTQVVADINTGRSSNTVSMDLLRKIFWLTVTHNCHLVAEHIPGERNVVADTLSRFTDDNDIPLYLCCRNRETPHPGLQGCGAQGQGMVRTTLGKLRPASGNVTYYSVPQYYVQPSQLRHY